MGWNPLLKSLFTLWGSAPPPILLHSCCFLRFFVVSYDEFLHWHMSVEVSIDDGYIISQLD